MPELQIPYLTRQLARRQLSRAPSGGGSVGSTGLGLRVPEASAVYGQQAALGDELADLGSQMARLHAQRQKAKDVATLTALESSQDEAVAFRAEAIKRDASIHPFEWGTTLQAERDQLLKDLDVPDRLRGVAEAKIKASTSRYLINLNAEGTKRGIEVAHNAYDLYADQQSRAWLNAGDANERLEISDRMRQKTKDYMASGLLSPDQGAKKLRDWEDQTQYDAYNLALMENPRAFLQAAEQGALSDLPADMRVKLLDKAQSERRSQAEWQDAEDRRAEKKVADQQAINSSKVRAEVYAMGGGPQAIRLINAEREAGRLSEADHSSNLSFAIQLQNHRASMAASAASRAASEAQRQEMIQRRKDADNVGMLITRYLDQKPGPDGQLVTAGSLNDMLTAGKFNGTVAGETAQKIYSHETSVAGQLQTEKGQAYSRVLANAEANFDQLGLRKSESKELTQVWGLYRDELHSKVWLGGTDPDTAHEQIFNKYVLQATGLLGERQRLVLQSLPPAYQTTPAQGVEPALTQAQQDFLSGFLTEDQYRLYARKLRELEQYPEFVEAQKRRRAPQSSSPAPTTPEAPGVLGRIKQQATGALGFPKTPLSSPEAQ